MMILQISTRFRFKKENVDYFEKNQNPQKLNDKKNKYFSERNMKNEKFENG